MTWITYEEANLIARSSKRPRFALCVWLALLELAEGESEWQSSRSRLAEVALGLLPPDRFAERHAARIARMSEEQEGNRAVGAESDTVVEQRERDRATRLAMEHAAGNPIGENVSRTLTELRRGAVDRDRVC